jgi:alpha-D-ribose 1-methylphosphonate 5-triphosphate synthase subunit PhnH
MMDGATLTGGFADSARDSARAFRAAMDAMAHPGRIVAITGAAAPAPVSPAAAALLLTLCDPDTPLWLAPSHDQTAVRAWLAFHTGAPLTDVATCRFAIGTWDSLGPIAQFPAGTPEYPDRSTTLIVERDGLLPQGARLTGPGIRGTAALNLPETAALQWNRARFPLGIDLFFTAASQIAALPRSTQVN